MGQIIKFPERRPDLGIPAVLSFSDLIRESEGTTGDAALLLPINTLDLIVEKVVQILIQNKYEFEGTEKEYRGRLKDIIFSS